MQAEQVYKTFVETAKYYLKELDYYGNFQFSNKPLEGNWSIGQLYDHLIHGTTAFHLKEIKNCLERRNGEVGGKKNFKGKVTFQFKKFLFKVKGGNNDGYQPSQPESPAKIKDDLYRFLKVMSKTAKEIDAAGNLDYKTRHPDLGYLNALEWFKLIDIHYNYHKKLKKQLDPHIRSQRKELAVEEEH